MPVTGNHAAKSASLPRCAEKQSDTRLLPDPMINYPVAMVLTENCLKTIPSFLDDEISLTQPKIRVVKIAPYPLMAGPTCNNITFGADADSHPSLIPLVHPLEIPYGPAGNTAAISVIIFPVSRTADAKLCPAPPVNPDPVAVIAPGSALLTSGGRNLSA